MVFIVSTVITFLDEFGDKNKSYIINLADLKNMFLALLPDISADRQFS